MSVMAEIAKSADSKLSTHVLDSPFTVHDHSNNILVMMLSFPHAKIQDYPVSVLTGGISLNLKGNKHDNF